mmetsp:Transcript_32409/g.80323  ORF Transcript_32409/g.80323 Transcript_32409/m.80323 type:complete len:229 (+) Transcript_32409:785-1471(+)
MQVSQHTETCFIRIRRRVMHELAQERDIVSDVRTCEDAPEQCAHQAHVRFVPHGCTIGITRCCADTHELVRLARMHRGAEGLGTRRAEELIARSADKLLLCQRESLSLAVASDLDSHELGRFATQLDTETLTIVFPEGVLHGNACLRLGVAAYQVIDIDAHLDDRAGNIVSLGEDVGFCFAALEPELVHVFSVGHSKEVSSLTCSFERLEQQAGSHSGISEFMRLLNI